MEDGKDPYKIDNNQDIKQYDNLELWDESEEMKFPRDRVYT